MKKSWQTTTCGVLIIVGCLAHVAVLYLQHQPIPSFLEIGACMSAGVGLIRAADHSALPGGSN